MSEIRWCYLPTGEVTHALIDSVFGRAAVSQCGISWWSDSWRGTGSQAEYERVATLPRCRRCTRKLG